jgi:hypothetical protein
MRHLLIVSAIAFALADRSAEAGAPVELEMLDGRTLSGELVGFSTDEIVVRSVAGEETFPTADLLAVRLGERQPGPTEGATAWLELTDGSTLPATRFSVSGDQARTDLVDGSELEVPTRSIASVKLMRQDEEIARQWDSIVAGNIATAAASV